MTYALDNQDRYGYYQVGDQKFYSKFLAIFEHKKTNQPVQWHFNDDVFGTLDWTQEPGESLDELYRRRAQQLREKYDYLVLWFSGGADSSNILDSFVSNNIPLDEVASYVNIEADRNRDGWMNNEIYNSAVPRIEKIKEQQPWLKHTLIDIAQSTVDFFTEQNAKFDWIFYINSYVNPNNVSRWNIKQSQSHWRQLMDSGKSVCFIWGVDKPWISAINGKYWFSFRDMLDSAVTSRSQMAKLPGDFDELFYWTPDSPHIVIKQAHVIKNFVNLHRSNHNYVASNYSSTVTTLDLQGIRRLHLDTLHWLIYPRWAPYVTCPKAPSLIFTPRDSWFFALPDNDPAKYAWRTGLEYAWSQTPDSFKKNPQDISKGFDLLKSRMYYIGT